MSRPPMYFQRGEGLVEIESTDPDWLRKQLMQHELRPDSAEYVEAIKERLGLVLSHKSCPTCKGKGFVEQEPKQ